MKLRIKKITKPNINFWNSFDKLVHENCELNVHLNSIWLSNYIKYYLEASSSVYILAAYQDSNLVGCLPLQAVQQKATRFYNYTELRILGFGPTDFFDIPTTASNKAEITRTLVRTLKKDKSWDKIILTSVPEKSENLKCFLKALKKEKLRFTLDNPNGFAFTKTVGDWDSFFENKFKSKNKDLAKSERRVARKGYKLKFTTYRENVYSKLLENLDLYAQRRESLGQFNTYETENLNQFLRNIIESFEEKEWVELTTLEANGDVLAFQLDWIKNKTRYHWNHAYNEDYKRYSPGKLILKELLKKSFDDPGIDYCNHMRGLSGYKEKFTEEKQMLSRVRVDNPSSLKLKLMQLISRFLKVVKR